MPAINRCPPSEVLAFAAMALLSASPASSQEYEPPRAAKLAAAERLVMLEGRWAGAGTVVTPDGTFRFRQQECVRAELGGLVFTIRGTGYPENATDDSPPAFEALMTVHFDPQSGAYLFRSHESNGGWSGDGTMTVDGNVVDWSHPAGPGSEIRYRIEIEGDTWHETGVRHMAGGRSVPFFEMTLARTSPACGPAQ